MKNKFFTRILPCICALSLMLCLYKLPAEPVALAGNTGAADMAQTTAANEYTSAAITQDGRLMVWGANYQGYLGTDGTGDTVLPTEIMSDVVSIYTSEGPIFSAALKKDGSLWTWGNNNFGQLGDGTKDNNPVPQKIMDGAAMVSMGQYHCAAVKNDGTLWVWGDNQGGQLGDGTTDTCLEPKNGFRYAKIVSITLQHSHLCRGMLSLPKPCPSFLQAAGICR